MKENFTINFTDSVGRAIDRVVTLGTTLVDSTPPPAFYYIEHNVPYSKKLVDPYKTYFTIALPPSSWRFIAKNELPTIDEQTNYINKTFNKNLKIKADIFYNFEINKDLERIHIHGVLCNKKNMNQLVLFKKIIRKILFIPSGNKVAIKTYQQSKYKTEEKMLDYHLKGIDYSSNRKHQPCNVYHYIPQAVGSERKGKNNKIE